MIAPSRQAPARSVAYVIGTYPLLTTTFIDREIVALRGRGVDVRIVAVRRPDPDAPLSAAQRALQGGVTYLLPASWWAVGRAHVRMLVRRPARLVATVARLLTRPHRSLRARLKTVLHVGEGVYAADLLASRPPLELVAHFTDRAATIAMVAARLLDRPYSLSVHAGADLFVEPVLVRDKIGQARKVVTCTAANRTRIASLVGTELAERVEVVPHGVELSTYRRTARDRPGDPLVLAVGQLTARKGLAHLVRACAHLRDRGVPMRCEIVGRGPEEAALRALVHEWSLESHVALCGARSPVEVRRRYEHARVVVLPCVAAASGDVDGIPNVLLEAMAMRVPVVSSDLPAIRELIVDGLNGLLVPSADAVSLADALERVLTDDELAERLAAAARRTVAERFDVERNVDRLCAVLWPELPAPNVVRPGRWR